MDIISGKHASTLEGPGLAAWAGSYHATVLDLGTGDGRFVQHFARRRPELAVIGVDLNAANLRRASRTAPSNALFAIADALALPDALSGVATHVMINFPWGSLLRGLLTGDPALIGGLRRVAHGGALDIRVNAGALAEAGMTLDEGGRRLTNALRESGIAIQRTSALAPADLRDWPTTWSKRLAFGRDPRAIQITASLTSPRWLAQDIPDGRRSRRTPLPAVSIAATAGAA